MIYSEEKLKRNEDNASPFFPDHSEQEMHQTNIHLLWTLL
jgi:hypothetical protein